jgi:DNA-binding NarL/FixJ family response regulator
MHLLIADDDDYTRLGLIEAIDWKGYGIQEIMQAKDGAEALRVLPGFNRISCLLIFACRSRMASNSRRG